MMPEATRVFFSLRASRSAYRSASEAMSSPFDSPLVPLRSGELFSVELGSPPSSLVEALADRCALPPTPPTSTCNHASCASCASAWTGQSQSGSPAESDSAVYASPLGFAFRQRGPRSQALAASRGSSCEQSESSPAEPGCEADEDEEQMKLMATLMALETAASATAAAAADMHAVVARRVSQLDAAARKAHSAAGLLCRAWRAKGELWAENERLKSTLQAAQEQLSAHARASKAQAAAAAQREASLRAALRHLTAECAFIGQTSAFAAEAVGKDLLELPLGVVIRQGRD